MPPRETTTPTGNAAGATYRLASLVSRHGGPRKYTTEEVGKHSTPEVGRCELDPGLKAPRFQSLIVKRISVLST